MNSPALIFDLDGTLTDPRAGISRCLAEAIKAAGGEQPALKELDQYIGPPLHQVLDSIFGAGERSATALAAFRESYSNAGLFECAVYPGVNEGLQALADVAPALLVATSKPRALAVRILEHFGLEPLFRGIYGSELTGELSNKDDLLRHLLARERLAPGQAVMIGDRKYDVAAARANGLRSVAVTWGFGSREELAEAGADRIVDSMSDLVALCAAWDLG